MLFTGYRKTSEASGGAGTLTFKGRNILSAGVVAYIFDLITGTFGDITKIVVAAGGQNIVNCTPAQLNAMLLRLTRGNYYIPGAATRFQIPFYALDMPANSPQGIVPKTPQEGLYRYNQQFPGKLEPEVQLTFGAACEARIGWKFTDEPGFTYPLFLSSGLGSPAGAGDDQTFDITQPGLIRGFTFPTTGLTRLKVAFGSRDRFEWSKKLFIEDDQLEAADRASTSDNPVFHKIHGPEEAAKVSKFEFDTDGAWPASQVAAVYSILPQP